MPYERPGQGFYTTATKAVEHNAPVVENGIAGVAVKQKATAWDAGLAGRQTIQIGEAFHIRTKGIRQVPMLTGATKGAAVYITEATNALSLTAGGVPYGKVVEIQGQRGTPTGSMRVDLDLKDTVA